MLEVRDLSVRYRGTIALRDIGFTLAGGNLVGLVGPNGAGKSTLLQALVGLVPAAGLALYNGKPLKRQRQRVAYVPQRSQIDWDYPICAGDVVALAGLDGRRWWRSPSARSRRVAEACLERVGMADYRDRPIGALSGGQQQRIFIARALARDADIFLLDEPFAGVDRTTEAVLFDLLDALKQQGKIVLASSHQWGQILTRYDRLLLLNQTSIADGSPDIVMTLPNLERAYGISSPQNGRRAGDRDEVLFC